MTILDERQQITEKVKTIISKVIKLCDRFLGWTMAQRVSPIARGRTGTLFRNSQQRSPAGVSALGALGAESVSVGSTQSLFLVGDHLSSEADNYCNVLHQMRKVLEKTFSLLFQVVVLKF